MSDDKVQAAVSVPALPDRAYDIFVNGFRTWWPAEYTWSQGNLDHVFIEARVGGGCIERSNDGRDIIWGHVVSLDPPRSLAFTWLITGDRRIEPDPGKAGTVAVRFDAEGDAATRVTLEHRDFARYGAGWQDYHAAMASPYGWPFCLDSYAAAVT